MKKFIFILLIFMFACKKSDRLPRTIYITYFLKTTLAANQKLFVQYIESYNMSTPYQYGKLKSDTINADSFKGEVNYSACDSKIKGRAGYLKFAIITYQSGNHAAVAYGLNSWKKFGAMVNGVEQHNYKREGVYDITDVNW